MPDKTFDLGDYVTVPERISLFYELFAQGRLVTTNVQLTTEPDGKPRVMVEAAAYRTADDPLPGRGWSWMLLPGTSNFTRGSELENAETSAWGRAIASLGILTAGGVASNQEVKSKQGTVSPRRQDEENGAAEQRTTHADGLIGKAIAQGTQDFMLRQGPDGYSLPFRIKEGRLSQIAVAMGPIAQALDTYRDETIGERVTVWGTYTDESYNKGDDVITYKVLHVERIKTPAFEMPFPDAAEPTEAISEPLPFEPLDEEEQRLIAGGLSA